jgi:hypothetical protein
MIAHAGPVRLAYGACVGDDYLAIPIARFLSASQYLFLHPIYLPNLSDADMSFAKSTTPF